MFAPALLLAVMTGRLPLESFTVAQGLPSDSVTAIRRDSRGFLWFGTLDGLSRYDGSSFVNYTTDQGIPDRMIWTISEDRENAMWVGTSEGVARMTGSATRGRHLFTRVLTPKNEPVSINLFVDGSGVVYSSCGADLCVFRNGKLEVEPGFRNAGGNTPSAIVESAAGDLWIGTDGGGLFRRRANGTWQRYAVQPVNGNDGIGGVELDGDGRLWITTGYGCIVWSPSDDDRDARPLVERAGAPLMPGMPMRLPQRGEAVMFTAPKSPLLGRQVLRTRDGTMWVSSYAGLFRVAEGRIDFFDANDGLPLDLQGIGEDAAGDLWIGTRGSGVFRLARDGATTWTREHGLANERILSIFTLDDGSVCAVNRAGLSCFREDAIHHGTLWTKERPAGWGWNQIVARDRDGSLWAASERGLIHWPRVAKVEDLGRIAPLEVLTFGSGHDGDQIFRVFEDSSGGLWAGTFGPKHLAIRRPDGTIQAFAIGATPTAFAEDRAGNVWIGLYTGGLIRVRGTSIEPIRAEVPPGLVRTLVVDSKGGLWMGTTSGVARIDDPTLPANRLSVRRWSRADGLASDSGYCIVEMPDGRIAIGSQRGLDVLDPDSGGIVHVSMREGLASNEVTVAMADGDGALWLGTVNGISRLARIPTPRFLPPPRLRIDAIAIDGAPAAVAELGSTAIDRVRIEYPRHAMAVGFSAPHFDPTRPLRFEYRLSENAPWTAAGIQRVIVFDRLPSGAGTLEVRAVTASGRTSEPARVSFVVVPAMWKRTWFLALVVAFVLLLGFAAHRYRVAQVVAIERVRTRAATDLHDDLGSSLSRISILSEVAKRKLGTSAPEPILDEIADSARGLVDALGDSIWAIDPHRDDVRSLLLRVRHFAAAVFEAESIAIDVQLAPDVATLPLKPEQRRETYLILKEALNNAAKHAKASHVAVTANAEGRFLRIAVEDDGKGFVADTTPREEGGRGVPSMIDRAQRAGGRLEINSEPGRGTRVVVMVPV